MIKGGSGGGRAQRRELTLLGGRVKTALSSVITAAILAATVGSALAQTKAPGIDLSERVKTLIAAVSYQKSKGMREPGPFVIALVSDPRAPRELIEKAHQAFLEHKNMKVGNKPIKLIVLNYDDEKKFKATLIKEGVDAVFITAGSRRITRQILNVTREIKVLSITAVADYVHRLGASLGVEARAGKPKLLINLSSCKNEGVEFDSRLLRLASVYF